MERERGFYQLFKFSHSEITGLNAGVPCKQGQSGTDLCSNYDMAGRQSGPRSAPADIGGGRSGSRLALVNL